jgi:hypothetical protein
MQNFDHNIGFWEKRQFFRQNLSKIAENCDHNIAQSGHPARYICIISKFGTIYLYNVLCT